MTEIDDPEVLRREIRTMLEKVTEPTLEAHGQIETSHAAHVGAARATAGYCFRQFLDLVGLRWTLRCFTREV